MYEKSRMMTTRKSIKPTEGELEILQVLWNKGTATVREVHDELLRYKEAGYTTTLKLMQIMYEKGLVSRDASHKSHLYRAVVNREKTQQLLVGKMIDSLFAGSPAQLVMQALGNHKATPDELEAIRSFLHQMKK